MEQATLPPERLNELNELCKNDFKSFVQEIVGLDNQPFHDELDDDIAQEFNPDSPIYQMVQRFFACITYPREHGKSTHLSIAYPLWRIAKNHDIRILSISRTANIAESFLSQVVSNVERNLKYREWAKAIDTDNIGVVPRLKKGRRQTEDWSGKSITIERPDMNMKDPTIAATGLFGQILSRRADIIILDDVVDQQNSATELQRKKVIDWIETTVIPVLVPGGTFIYLGNTWHMDDAVARFLKDPRFIVQKRKGAIIRDADRKDLWEEWGSKMLDITRQPKERVADAMNFYKERKNEMDAGAEVLWKERLPYSRLYLERLINPYVFARMYQCFTPDTLVRVESGLKQIKDVRVGELVLTHKGRLMPVLKTIKNKGNGAMLSIKVEGFSDSIRVTNEHPIFTPRGWKKAGELSVGDKVLGCAEEISNGFRISVERARIYGWYLAEGSIGVHGRVVTFSLATKEKNNINELSQALQKEGFAHRNDLMKNESTCTNIHVNSKELADELVALFGKAKTKHLPSIVLGMSHETREEMLLSYLKGDGHRQGLDSWRTSSVCIDLVDGIARIAESIGWRVSKRFYRQRMNSTICGRVIKTNGYDHVLNLYRNERENLTHKIKSIKKIYYYDTLYNLEVAVDNSYSLAHFAVHNCDPSERPDQVIKNEWIERALMKGQHLRFQNTPHPRNVLEVSAAGMDLAISQKESADDTSVSYLDLVRYGYDGVDNGDFILRQIHRGHFTPNEQRKYAKQATNEHGMSTIRVESVGYQEALVIDLADEAVPVRSYNTGREKFDPEIGINSLALLMELGKLVIPSDPTDPRTIMLAAQLANEMRAYSADPTAHTGDGLMSLWFAYSEIRTLLGSRIIVPKSATMEIKDSQPIETPEQRAPLEKKADDVMRMEQEAERANFQRLMRDRMLRGRR